MVLGIVRYLSGEFYETLSHHESSHLTDKCSRWGKTNEGLWKSCKWTSQTKINK